LAGIGARFRARSGCLLLRIDTTGTDGRVEAFNRAAFEFTCCWPPEW
jgi:hypothetical protein